MRVIKWLTIGLLGIVTGVLHACGFTAVLWSTLFTVAYDMALTAVVSYQNEHITQRSVVACRIVDQTRLLLVGGYDVKMRADPPLFSFRDGSVLVLSPTPSAVCRWHTEQPPSRVFRFDADRSSLREGIFGVSGEAFHFDNPSNPTVLRIYQLKSLMERGSPTQLLLDSVTAGLTQESPSHTVRTIFPFAKWAEDHREGEQAHFIGLRTKLLRLSPGSQCAELPVSGSSWLRVAPNQNCACSGRTSKCWIEIGSLSPLFSGDYGRVDFKSHEISGASSATLVRLTHLKAHKARLSAGQFWVNWHTLVCFDGDCNEMAIPRASAAFYKPDAKMMLHVTSEVYAGNGLPHGMFRRQGMY